MARSRRRYKKIDKTPQQAEIISLSHEGAGIAKIEGKTTFIQGALPSEQVEFVYTEVKKDYAKGVSTDVLQASEQRVTPPCQHYDMCGGCSLQHLSSASQIEFKQSVLLENLKHIGQVEPQEVLTPITGDTLGYRHKGRLSVRYVHKKEKVLVGFRERLSGRFIADIEQCQILHPNVGLLISPLKALMASLDGYRHIAQIEVAVGENKTIFILRHLEPLIEDDCRKLLEFAKQHDISWYLQPGGEDSIYPLLKDDDLPLTYTLPQLNLSYEFRPNDFTQVNPSINRQMVLKSMDLLQLKSTDRVLDLFCGLGNFSLPLAQKAQAVVGVEGCTKMTKRAASNAKLNSISNTEFYCANLFEELTEQPWAKMTFDKILIDPPRAGAKELCQQIGQFGAERIVYVSCSTATLARDSKLIVDQGYQLVSAGVMDMFPHTGHVESIALFIKQ